MATPNDSEAARRRRAPRPSPRATITVLVAVLLVALVQVWPEPPEPPAPPLAAAAPGPPAAAVAADALAAAATAHRQPDTDAAAAARSEQAPPPDPDAADAATGYRGRVLGPGSEPVPGITVRLLRVALDAALAVGVDAFAAEPPPLRLEAARATTGEDGRFVLGGVLPRGLCWLSLEWDDPERAPPRFRAGHRTTLAVQRAPAPGEVVDLGDLWLAHGALLTGRVVDADGEPIAGALVRAAALPPLPFAAVPIERIGPGSALLVTAPGQGFVGELPAWTAAVFDALPIRSATTRGDGTFALCGVDAGAVVVAVTAPARASLLRQGVQAVADAVTALGDLRLDDGEAAAVAVTDAAGEAIAGAEVIVAPLSVGVPVHVGERAAATGADGRTLATGLPRGRAIAAARRSPRDAWTIGEPGPAGGLLRVVLPARHDLTLHVLAPDGTTARDVALRLFRGGAAARLFDAARFGLLPAIDLRDRLETGDDGTLRVRDLDGGPLWALLRARGCAAAALPIELDADAERTVRLRASRPLAVQVLDAAGDGVPSATVCVEPRGGEYPERLADLPLAAARTDRDGRCTVRDLPTGETRVSATHPRHGSVHAIVQGTPPGIVLQFAAAGRIEGRLTDGGRAPALGRWVVVLQRRHDEGSPRGAAREVPQLAMPDARGEFAFAALQPGRYRLVAQDSVADVGTIAGLVAYQARRTQIYPWNRCEVDLAPGATARVRLDAILDVEPWTGPGADVRGVVTLDGVPAAGAVVVGTSKAPHRRVASRVDPGGTFEFGRCPAGELRVVVVPRDVAESRLLENVFSHAFARDVTVVDGVPLDLQIAVATGAVAGTVRDGNGAPVAGCRVVLFDRGGGGRSSSLRIAHTDAAGAFRIGELPAGRFELRANDEGAGRADLFAIDVGAGAEVPIDVVLRATARVAGRVELSDRPAADVRIVLQPEGGGEPASTGTGAHGEFELRNVLAGSHRVLVLVPGEPRPRDAGVLLVSPPATLDVVLRATP